MKFSNMQDKYAQIQVITDKILKFSDNILKFLGDECLKDKHSVGELYIAVKYVLSILEQNMGKDTVDELNKKFQIVVPQEETKC